MMWPESGGLNNQCSFLVEDVIRYLGIERTIRNQIKKYDVDLTPDANIIKETF